MKRVMTGAAALILALGCTVAWSAWKTQMAMAEKMVRLHVVAHSDAEEDQEKKLLVRDAVLAMTEKELKHCRTREDAEQRLKEMLPRLEQAAGEALGEEKGAVKATLSREIYPERRYDTFSLPAGEYLSLQVKIGEAAGKNWWCVVYPPLCLAATVEEVEEEALAAGWERGEVALILQENKKTAVKFKLISWLCDMVS